MTATTAGYLLAVSLATATLTRLVVHDTILDPLRRRWTRSLPSWGVKLLSCPWCISAWLAAALTAILAALGYVPLPLLAWLAVWQGGKMLFWATEMMSRFGVDAPIEVEYVEADDA